eukprot:gene948-1843_t
MNNRDPSMQWLALPLGTKELKNAGQKVNEPRQPEGPKRSAISTYSKAVAFKPYVNSNPALLQEVNNIVTTGLVNLRKVDVSNTTSNELDVLQIYSEAFERFIDEFTIYRPFLLSVKHEYDKIVSMYSSQAHVVLSLKSQFATRENECNTEKKELIKGHERSMEEAKLHIKSLEKILFEREKEIFSLSTNLNDLKKGSDKIDKELEEARSSCVTLTSSLTRMDQDRAGRSQREVAREHDVAILRVALDKANEECERLRRVIQDNETVTKLLVPQNIVDGHLENIESLRLEITRLDSAHRALIGRYSVVKASIDEALKRYETNSSTPKVHSVTTSEKQKAIGNVQFTASTSNMKTLATKPFSTDINSGSDQSDPVIQQLQLLLARGGRPRLIIEALVDEVEALRAQLKSGGGGGGTGHWSMNQDGVHTELSLPSPWGHFEGLGLVSSAPPYLRVQGRVRNQMLSRPQAKAFVSAVWLAKAVRDKERSRSHVNTAPLQLSDSLGQYLTSRFQSQNQVVEAAYSLMNVLRGPGGTGVGTGWTEGRIFLMVLEGSLPEEVRGDTKLILDIDRVTAIVIVIVIKYIHKEALHEEESQLPSLHKASVSVPASASAAVGVAIAAQTTGRLPVESFLKILRRHAPVRLEPQLSKLEKAVLVDTQGAPSVNYGKDSEVGGGVFALEMNCPVVVETLRAQHLSEYQQYSEHIISTLDMVLSGGTIGGAGSVNIQDGLIVTLAKIRDAFSVADGDKPRGDVSVLLARGLGAGTTVEAALLKEASDAPVSWEAFKNNLQKGMLKRSPVQGLAVIDKRK